MASRVNTKLILILFVSAAAALSVIAGVWFLQMRGDASRAARIGDQYMQQGEIEKAKSSYSRALSREPGRAEFIRKLQEAILAYTPATTDAAVNWYREYLGVLRHRSVYRPGDLEGHRILLDELHQVARRSRIPVYWQELRDESLGVRDRWNGDPEDIDFASIYETMARLRLEGATLLIEEIEAEVSRLQDVVDRHPNDDLARATLLSGRTTIILRLARANRAIKAQEGVESMLSALTEAEQAVPNGLDTIRAVVVSLGLLQTMPTNDAQVPDHTVLAGLCERMLTLTEAGDQPSWLILEIADLGTVFDRQRFGEGFRNVLKRHLVTHPNDLDVRLALAELMRRDGQLEAALVQAGRILGAEEPTVGILAILYNQLRMRSTVLMGDVWFARWETGDEAGREDAIVGLQAIRGELVQLVPDPDANPLLSRLDGHLAYAQGDYETATAKFEALRSAGQIDLQTLILVSLSLERINQIGRAHERISEAVAAQPRNVLLILEKARLEFRLGRYDDADAALSEVLRLSPDNERALALGEQLLAARGLTATAAEDSNVALIIRDAARAADAGDFDKARASLQELATANPDSVPILQQLVAIEAGAGDFDAAQRHLSRAIELAPDRVELKRIQVLLDTDDPVEVAIRLAELNQTDEVSRLSSIVVYLFSLAQRQDLIAQQARAAGNDEQAREAEQVASAARVRGDEYATSLESMAPDHDTLINTRFLQAMQEKDWEGAEAQVRRAGEKDLDHAGGLVYQGRLERAQGRADEAMQTLKEATTRVGYSSSVWSQFADACEAAGDIDEAARAYGEAYRCNPTDIAAAQRYARLLIRTGGSDRALRILRDAFNLASNNTALRDQWLNLEMQMGDVAEVLRYCLVQYTRDPGDMGNVALLAEFLGYMKPERRLVMNEQGQEEITNLRWNQFSVLQQQQLVRERQALWRERSETLLSELAAQSENSFSIAVLRARIMRRRGEVNEGADLLRGAIEALPADQVTLSMYMAYAQYLIEINRYADSILWLQQALPLQDPVRREADVVLANLYRQLNQPSFAIPHLEKLVEVQDDLNLRITLFESHLGASQMEAAQTLLSDLTASEALSEFTVHLLSARLAQRRGEMLYADGLDADARVEFRAARNSLTQAQTLQPEFVQPHIQLAHGLLSEFRREGDEDALRRGLTALDEADRLMPGNVEARRLRVDVLLARQDLTGAIDILADLLLRDPADGVVRSQLITLRLSTGNGEEAIRLATEGVRLFPNRTMWHQQLGDLYLNIRGDASLAVGAYRLAYTIQPSLLILGKLSEAMLRLPTPAYGDIETLITGATAEVQAHPVIASLHARALAGLGRAEEAQAELRRAFLSFREAIDAEALPSDAIGAWYAQARAIFPADQPDRIEALAEELAAGRQFDSDYRSLAETYARADFTLHADRVIDLQRRAVESCADDRPARRAQFNFELAISSIRAERFQEAADAFEQVLLDDPGHFIARNNLAYLFADRLDRPRDALVHAREAVAMRPDNAMFQDTLGWVFYRLGQYDQAVRHLELSVNTNEEAGAYVHLAEVYKELGQLNEAATRLVKAGRLQPDEETQAAILRLQEELARLESQGG